MLVLSTEFYIRLGTWDPACGMPKDEALKISDLCFYTLQDSSAMVSCGPTKMAFITLWDNS